MKEVTERIPKKIQMRWTFETNSGGTKTLTPKNAREDLTAAEIDEIMLEMTTFQMLKGQGRFDLALPKRASRIVTYEETLVDHIQDGQLDERRKEQSFYELAERWQIRNDIDLEDLPQEEVDQICVGLRALVERYYQPVARPVERARTAKPHLTPEQRRERPHRFRYQAGALPNLNQLNSQDPLKTCVMLHDYLIAGGNPVYVMEAIRLVQLRERWSGETLILPQDYRVMELLYEQGDWDVWFLHYFQHMKGFFGALKGAQLRRQYQELHRSQGLARVVAPALAGKETQDSGMVVEAVIEETALE